MQSKCENRYGQQLRVLELYSGIAGFHFAVKQLPFIERRVIGVDINTVANRVYRHNHTDSELLERNIESITENEWSEWSPHLLTMSPPCQPFTRLGLKRDISDHRTKSFIHLMDVLSKIKKPPNYIIVENVKGFETSEMRNILIKTIQLHGYVFQEFLLSPHHLNIPNSRLRYYLIAKLNEEFCFDVKHSLHLDIPVTNNLCPFCSQNVFRIEESETMSIKSYLEDLTENELNIYLLPDNVLQKYCMILDIVNDDSLTTNCFTKSYTHRVEGTGSVLKCSAVSVSQIYKAVENANSDEEKLTLLKQLKLRYFTPKEVSNIMCFPSNFYLFPYKIAFPDDFTLKQKYRLLGNSVNVKVIALLLKLLLTNCETKAQT